MLVFQRNYTKHPENKLTTEMQWKNYKTVLPNATHLQEKEEQFPKLALRLAAMYNSVVLI